MPAYRNSARVYDLVYSWKDYRHEARRVHELVQRYGPRSASSLLDVACGTGSHLRYLSRWYRVTGVDRSTAMLREARRKLPGIRFVHASMQDFDLGERFDVITCLFSTIGYARSKQDLRRTLANFARHLAPGGIAIVEPWLTPSEYRVGAVHLGTYGSTQRPIVRMNTSERRGSRSRMDMHYLMPEGGRIRHWVERHDMTLFDVPTQLRAYRSVGFKVCHLPSRFTTTRGLFVAVRPKLPGESSVPIDRKGGSPMPRSP